MSGSNIDIRTKFESLGIYLYRGCSGAPTLEVRINRAAHDTFGRTGWTFRVEFDEGISLDRLLDEAHQLCATADRRKISFAQLEVRQ
jgi:hypothetical protein